MILLLLCLQDTALFAEKLNKAIADKDAEATLEAAGKLAAANSRPAAEAICGGLMRAPPSDPTIYWMLIDAAAAITDEAALKGIAEFLIRNVREPFAADVLYALQSNRAPSTAFVLATMLDRGRDDAQVLAAEMLADVAVPESVDALIAKLETLGKKESILRTRVVESLVWLTRKTLGFDAAAYRDWWKQNRGTAELGGGPAEEAKRDPTSTAVDMFPPHRKEIERLREREGTIVALASDCPVKDDPDAHQDWPNHDVDKFETLLKKMDVPHLVVNKSEFEKFNLKGRTALLVNCNLWRPWHHGKDCEAGDYTGMRVYTCIGKGPHLNVDNKLSDAAVKKIKEFVEKDGGYLFTEDWDLPELLERAWPEYVKSGTQLKEMEVKVMPAPGVLTHPYLRRVFKRDESLSTRTDRDFGHVWKIDDESPTIRITGGEKVTVLIVSKDLPAGDTAAAITFIPNSGGRPKVATGGIEQDPAKMKGGRVVHALSHFTKQKSQQDEFGLQNLLLNFLIEVNERRGPYIKK